MSLQYDNLDVQTRQCMLSEYEMDLSQNRVYLSNRLTDSGKDEYKALLTRILQ